MIPSLSIWFLAMTICTSGDDCHDYTLDEGLSYSDCITAVQTFKPSEAVFSVRCDRGTPTELTEELKDEKNAN